MEEEEAAEVAPAGEGAGAAPVAPTAAAGFEGDTEKTKECTSQLCTRFLLLYLATPTPAPDTMQRKKYERDGDETKSSGNRRVRCSAADHEHVLPMQRRGMGTPKQQRQDPFTTTKQEEQKNIVTSHTA